MPTEFVDAYVHCGLSKYKPLPEVERAMRLARVDRAVLVQHLGEFDNTYIQKAVTKNPEKFAGVFLVDYTQDSIYNELRRWANTGRFRGVRFLLESLELNPLLWQEAVNLNLNIIVYEPEGIAKGFNLLKNFLKKNPTATMILSHLGVPNLKTDPEFIQHGSLYQLSEYQNVYFQVSGMHMFCPYPYNLLWPVIKQGLDSFGAERMLWGSNYPVLGNDEDYVREVELIRSGGLPIPKSEIHRVMNGTAVEVWFS